LYSKLFPLLNFLLILPPRYMSHVLSFPPAPVCHPNYRPHYLIKKTSEDPHYAAFTILLLSLQMFA
jgi:hypothetical protein